MVRGPLRALEGRNVSSSLDGAAIYLLSYFALAHMLPVHFHAAHFNYNSFFLCLPIPHFWTGARAQVRVLVGSAVHSHHRLRDHGVALAEVQPGQVWLQRATPRL